MASQKALIDTSKIRHFPPESFHDIIATSSTVKINGEKVVLHDDSIVDHLGHIELNRKMIAACNNVFIEGKEVAIETNLSKCGGTGVDGSNNVYIGEKSV